MLPPTDLPTILRFIEDNLPSMKETKDTRGMVFTPAYMVNDCLDRIPKHVWANPRLRWLDTGSGVGNFSLLVMVRLYESLRPSIGDDHTRLTHIVTNMLHMVEICPDNIRKCRTMFGGLVSIVQSDFLAHDLNVGMDDYDVIVGNPPYNLDGNKSKGQKNVYALFARKALDMLKPGGYLAYLHPPGYRNGPDSIQATKTDLNDLYTSRQIISIRVYEPPEVLKHLKNIMINIDCIVVRNIEDPEGLIKTRFRDGRGGMHQVAIHRGALIPNFGFAILGRLETLGQHHGTVTLVRNSAVHANVTPVGGHKNIHAIVRKGRRVFRSGKLHPQHTTPKYIINGAGVNYVYDDTAGEYGVTQNCVIVIDPSPTMREFLSSPLFQFVCRATRITGVNFNLRCHRFIPLLDNVPGVGCMEDLYERLGVDAAFREKLSDVFTLHSYADTDIL